MKLPKKLILCGLALIFCVGVVWTFLIYKANRTIDQLKSDDWQVREKAMQSLSKSGKPAVGSLITALKDKDADIRWRAAKTLGDIEDSRAIEPLAEALKDKDSRVRYRAIESLGKIGDTPAIEPLIGALKDKDIDIVEKAAEALIKINKPAVEPLITVLKDEDNYTRMKAVEILGEIGDKRAAKPLVFALKDKDTNVRMEVAKAIVKIGKPAIEPLIMGFKDEDKFGKWRTATMLRLITGEYFGIDPQKWQKWWEENKDKFTERE